ncbi:MAG: S8 family serine peptidase [Rhodobacteraceae bacterium]|nr:S8 family serine peptidase [Paracoccaceae bacterium]
MNLSGRSSIPAVCIWLLLSLVVVPLILAGTPAGPWTAAFADDDGGDDDDDDDDDDDGGRPSPSAKGDNSGQDGAAGARSGNRGAEARARRKVAQQNARRGAQIASPRPAFAPEIVVSDLSAQDLSTLVAEGFVPIERRTITTLAVTLDRLAAPRAVSLQAARDRVRQLPSGGDADFNHFYRNSQVTDSQAVASAGTCGHENCAAWDMIGWTESKPGAEACTVTTAIGMIDTGINPDHGILATANLTVLPRLSAEGRSGAVHGTAVASVLVGDPASRVPGLLPGASVLAVDVFSRVAGDERADVVSLVEGLDALAARQIRLYNLSLAGPANSVLSRMLDRLTDETALDAVIVAAAGNGGPTAPPAWPGAHPKVISVTAVDSRGRVFAKAQRGDHIDLAAPGVNLLAATSIRGARAKSGTSFAVPFVTAAAAVLMSGPGPVPGSAVRAKLGASATDLGAPGRDAVFGDGLLSAAALCTKITE